MKLKDAERCAKATSVLLERLKASRTKLETAQKRAMAAVESVQAINDEISTAFTRWFELIEELDPDAELDAITDESDHLIKLDELTEEVEAAFESAAGVFEISDEFFSEVLERAQDYEEPEEDDDEEVEEFVFTCDHPGCKEETELDMTQAREAGWEIWAEPSPPSKKGPATWTSFCPKHRR
jgi:hypothetical protein